MERNTMTNTLPKTNTPLKTNTRWQRDESSEDKKSSTFSDNKFRPRYNNRGRDRGRG